MATQGTASDAIASRLIQRFGVQGKTALVTGGTQGIGKAIVEELAHLGVDVYTCSRSEEKLNTAMTEWRQQGLKVQGRVADVSKADERESLISEVRKVFNGKLNILVNNVGSNVRTSCVDATLDSFQFMIATNLESAFHLCQLSHSMLKASGDGSVLFNSSVAGGPLAMKSGSIYAMTKAAMNQLTKNLACEWGQDRIRVNSVAPWYTNTELAQQVLKNEEYKKGVLDRTPLKRVAEPSEVSGLMVYLCSPAASYITGQTICVDGGYSVMGFF